jgi:formylglycine-generating enzyme
MPWVGGFRRRRVAAALLAVSCAGLHLGCGKSESSPPSPTAGVSTAGSGGDAAGRASDGGASAGTSSAGRVGTAGRGGSDAGGEGGVATNDAGTTASGSGGTISTGGEANTGGTSGSGGGSAGNDVAGNGGAAGSGGAPSPCTGCRALESCWSDSSGARCVAALVPLPTGLAIDATEVTREQYVAWLRLEPATTGQSEACEWNDSFAPDEDCMLDPAVCRDADCATHPQPCVDFCDASAYCSALGRRLCTEPEWTSSCSSDGAAPLGREPGLSSCNDYTIGGTTTVPVASMPGCQPPADSGFAGVFDMIGNLEEWVDDCFSEDVCKPRGLSYGFGAAGPNCSQSTYAERSVMRENLGFRCCSPQALP